MYIEDDSGKSVSLGTDFGDSSNFKLVLSATPGSTPSSTPAQLVIASTVNGDITADPNGTGALVLASGNFKIPATTASTDGVIEVNSTRFIHSFGTDNTFVGAGAGNFTLTSASHTAVGARSMASLTGGASPNMNVALGDDTLNACTNGGGNIAIGSQALKVLTTGDFNIAIGVTTSGGSLLTTGHDNILIAGGDSYTGAESSNIIIQNNAVLGESNTIRLGTTGSGDGEQNRCFIAGTHSITPAGASIQPMVMDSSGQMGTQATLNVSQGGTGRATLTTNGLLYGNGTAAVGMLSAATNGQLPIGNTGNPPTLATLTAGAGIGIANGAGTITISGTGGGFTWTEVTGTSASLAVANGYIANNAGLVTLTLPVTAALGDAIRVLGKGAGLFRIAQNASQFINVVNSTTTIGVGGSLTATEQFDSILLMCTTANNGWLAEVNGNFTII